MDGHNPYLGHNWKILNGLYNDETKLLLWNLLDYLLHQPVSSPALNNTFNLPLSTKHIENLIESHNKMLLPFGMINVTAAFRT